MNAGNQIAQRNLQKQIFEQNRMESEERREAAEQKRLFEQTKFVAEKAATAFKGYQDLINQAAEANQPKAAEDVYKTVTTPLEGARGMTTLELLAENMRAAGAPVTANMLDTQLRGQIALIRTPQQIAEVEREQQFADIEATAERYNVSPQVAARGAGVLPAPYTPPAAVVSTFQVPGEAPFPVDMRDRAAVQDAINRGAIQVPRSLAATSEDDLGLTTATETGLEKSVVDTASQLQDLRAIRDSYNREALLIPERIKLAWSEFWEKMDVSEMDPEEVQLAQKITDTRQTAIRAINTRLNTLSGAAVSPAEAERIRAELPDAGTGILDGDSPVVFERKLNNALDTIEARLRIYNYANAKGLSALDIDTEDLPALVQQEGEAQEAQIRADNPGISDAAAEEEARRRVRKLFGIGG